VCKFIVIATAQHLSQTDNLANYWPYAGSALYCKNRSRLDVENVDMTEDVNKLLGSYGDSAINEEVLMCANETGSILERIWHR